jgi:hypothetical protein
MESETLRRALAAEELAAAACWADAALAFRKDRFAVLPAGSVAYERQTELNEGLARYVEQRALAGAGREVFPATEFRPEEVRLRAYDSGTALALLLDRLSPSWRTSFDETQEVYLGGLLEGALAQHGSAGRVCGLSPDEREWISERALHDVHELHARRAEQKRLVVERPGWTLIIDATGAPLFPQNFDPLNVQLLGPDEVLHTRLLVAGNQHGKIELIGLPSLTYAAGAHPLFNGIARLEVPGLSAEPQIVETNDTVTVSSDGLSGTFDAVVSDRQGQTIIIRVGATGETEDQNE